MTIQYFITNPNKEDYFELFETTGWNDEYGFSEDELIEAIRNSWHKVSAYDNDRLIGYGRIIADGIHHALIVDLIVHPDYQGKGVGREIQTQLINKCKKHNIRDIQLFCAKGKKEFYEKFNFVSRPDDAPGMELSIKKA